MNINGKHYRTIWLDPKRPHIVQCIDQRLLPFEFKIFDLATVDDFVFAIKEMVVRGAGLIGATAGYGMYCAGAATRPRGKRQAFLEALRIDGEKLIATRPTAVNLAWAVERQLRAIEERGESTAVDAYRSRPPYGQRSRSPTRTPTSAAASVNTASA